MVLGRSRFFGLCDLNKIKQGVISCHLIVILYTLITHKVDGLPDQVQSLNKIIHDELFESDSGLF
jgi:hypothetical protein